MTHNKSSIVGKKYGKNNQLTVLPWDGEVYKAPNSKGGDKIYKLFCTICAEDSEMYGDGIFKSHKTALTKGILPCGCSERPRYHIRQHEIKINRICKNRGYRVLDFNWGDEKNPAYSKPTLFCNNCQESWDTTSVSHLYVGHGCPYCAHKKIGKGNAIPDEDLIASFKLTGKYVEGTIFTRTTRKTGNTYVWEVTCPICSKDEYVQAGVCSGVFSAVISTLQNGALPCRCATNHIPTQAQKEYMLNKIFAKEPQYSFVRWDGEYKGNKGYMWVNCKEHGEWKVNLNNFTSDNATRCPLCNGGGGYNKDEEGFLYVLEVKGKSNFTGYGISNNPDKRLMDHKRNLKEFGFQIQDNTIIKMSGQQAIDIEKLLKKTFPKNSQKVEGFKTEATHDHLYDEVVEFIREYINT